MIDADRELLNISKSDTIQKLVAWHRLTKIGLATCTPALDGCIGSGLAFRLTKAGIDRRSQLLRA